MKNFIINALELSTEQYNSIATITPINDTDFIVELKVAVQTCPTCGELTTRIKGYTNKKISHKILLNRETILFYRQRRYLCVSCKSSFCESNPFTQDYTSKISSTTIISILNDLKPYNVTFSYIAKKYNLSTTKIISIFDNYVQVNRKPLSAYLCMDEFYFNRHSKYKYAFMIIDFEKKVILDIVESRHYSKLSSYFFEINISERAKVLYICTDMYKPYLSLTKTYFPNAIHCIDSFHVIKLINDALNQVRKRVMRLYAKQSKEDINYKLLKHKYRILFKNNDTVNHENYYYDYLLRYHTTQQKILDLLLKTSDDLLSAYRLKESYIQFNSIEEETFEKTTHSKFLDSIIIDMKESNLLEFKNCAATLKKWKEYIINSFHWVNNRRISNGVIEGKNTYLKKMISNANGFQNFNRARNRFLYSQNLYEKYSLIPLNPKKKGKKQLK